MKILSAFILIQQVLGSAGPTKIAPSGTGSTVLPLVVDEKVIDDRRQKDLSDLLVRTCLKWGDLNQPNTLLALPSGNLSDAYQQAREFVARVLEEYPNPGFELQYGLQFVETHCSELLPNQSLQVQGEKP